MPFLSPNQQRQSTEGIDVSGTMLENICNSLHKSFGSISEPDASMSAIFKSVQHFIKSFWSNSAIFLCCAEIQKDQSDEPFAQNVQSTT